MTTPQDRITAFWSMVAPGYEAHEGNVAEYGTAEYDEWVELLRGALPSAPSDVLDLGTGTGYVALAAAALGHRVTAIDLAEPMLEEARRTAKHRCVDVDFRVGDAVKPPFPPGSFDVITNRHLLWTLRDAQAAVTGWRRLLRPGGRVVSIDGFWAALTPEADGVFGEHYTEETRAAVPLYRATSTDPIVRLFQRSGFAEVTVADAGPPYVLIATT